MQSILLVDDDIPFSAVVRNTLEIEGYRVHTVHHAHDAINFLHHHYQDVSVMLLDWSMPDVTGIDLLKQIKQQKEYEDIEVIMQTIMNDPENIKQGVEAGAFFYLVKPVKKDLLIATIKMAVQDHERKQALLKRLRESENSFSFLKEGSFQFRTVEEGDQLALRIANFCPKPEEAMYLTELITNAVEHGNLNISYEEKTKLNLEGRLSAEMNRRLALTENKKKCVTVKLIRDEKKITVLIEDMGPGFDYESFLRFDDDRLLHNHGRGIAISNTFLNMQYIGKGNKVMVIFPLKDEDELN